MNPDYEDDRFPDRADDFENGEPAAIDSPGSDSVFEAPDLATAFLAALDAIDDPRFVAPPPEEPAPAETLAAAALEPGTLELTSTDPASDATVDPGANADSRAEATADSPVELIAETVSNADSYWDPDTLRLARPLFSPDEPRAFAAPVYVGETGEVDTAGAEASEGELLDDLEEFVAFSLGDTRCVVPIRNVIEIGRIPQAVAVPNAPAWLHGLGNLRGQVLSLIDLRAFLGIGRVRPATGRMLVLRGDDDDVQAGVLVDHVHQIVSLSASRFHPAPETLPRHYARHAWGVCDYGNYTMVGLEVDSLLGVESMTPSDETAEVL